MSIEKIVKTPEDCSDVELKSFEKLVTEDGEVALVGLRQRIKRAEKLVFINDDQCVAVGAIKNPKETPIYSPAERSAALRQPG